MKYIIFLLTMSVFFDACMKEECKFNGHYEFEVPASLSPANDTFNLGDTIKIISSFPSEIYERNSDQKYTLENFRFYPGTFIHKIDTSVGITKIQDYFDIIIATSFNYHFQIFSDGTEGLSGQYTYSNGVYDLEFRLVAKKQGLFFIEQGVAADIESNQDFEGKCSIKDIEDGAVIMNNGTDNNIHMLSDSPDPHYNDWILQKPEERFYKFGGYCFYVKE